MIIRIKVEQFYEVEVADGPIDDIKNDIETDMGDGVMWYLDNVADYIGRDLYIEPAMNHGKHDYTQLDVY